MTVTIMVTANTNTTSKDGGSMDRKKIERNIMEDYEIRGVPLTTPPR
jgi:hypothetical protein